MAVITLTSVQAYSLDEKTYLKFRAEMLREEIRHLKAMEKFLAEGDVSRSSVYEKAFAQNQKTISVLTEKYGVTLKDYYEYPVANQQKLNAFLEKSENRKTNFGLSKIHYHSLNNKMPEPCEFSRTMRRGEKNEKLFH